MDDRSSRFASALADRYRIESEIGSGGMATVYLAQDLRHDRKVAVKVLKPELAAVLGAERFLAEIKVTANLQHPHILPLHDSGDAEGFLYYVMPYVEGESLRARLAREGQLPVDEAVRIAGEVADALDHAHRKGVIHRDIKPGNILFHEGRALLADFGIAIAMNAAGGARLTETGLSLGTPHYMSPEQAAGDRQVDARSDVYSLAAVVYEMIAGSPPHTGSSAQAVVAKILTERPAPLRQLRRLTPLSVEEAVDRALERIPADRHDSPGDFALDLRTERERVDAPLGQLWGVMAGTALLAAAAAAIITAAVMRVPREEGGPFSAMSEPTAVERPLTLTGTAEGMGISPDGRMVAYLTPRGLVTRDVRGGRETLVLAVDDPALGLPGQASPLRSDPRWSADGSALLFVAKLDSTRFRIASVPRLGGDVTPLADTSFATGEVRPAPIPFPDGEKVLLVRILEPKTERPWLRVWDSGELRGIEIEEEADRIWDATVSPTGEWIAYIAEREDRSTYLGTVSLDGSTTRRILEGGQELSKWGEMSAARVWANNRSLKWVAQDRLYFRRHGSRGMDLWQIRVDPRTGEALSPPRLAYPRLPRGTSWDVSSDAQTLAYAGGPNRAHVHLFRIGEADGGTAPYSVLTRGTGWNVGPRIAPDGNRVVFEAKTSNGADLIVADLVDGTLRSLNVSYDWTTVWASVWSPDGQRLLAMVEGDEGPRLILIEVVTGRVDVIPDAVPGPVQIGWSPDGRTLLFGSVDGGYRILHDLETGESRRLFEEVGGELIFALFSPDGSRVLTQDWGTGSLWSVSVDGQDLREGARLDGLFPRPVWWGPDGTVIVVDILTGRVTSLPWEGGEVRLLAQLPFECIHEGLQGMDLQGGVLACSVRDAESDVWVVEDFDPEVARRGESHP
jgi:Tol biopolymer transport system component